jgi:hypothetical protein
MQIAETIDVEDVNKLAMEASSAIMQIYKDVRTDGNKRLLHTHTWPQQLAGNVV